MVATTPDSLRTTPFPTRSVPSTGAREGVLCDLCFERDDRRQDAVEVIGKGAGLGPVRLFDLKSAKR